MTLREKQMADRRRRILDAAEELIRDTRGADFSMLALANRAEVSPATPYNIFGSKTQLLFALFNRSLAELPVKDLTASIKDPVDRLLETTEVVSAHLAARADFFQPLYRAQFGVFDDVHRPEFVEHHLQRWKRALADIERADLLSPGVTANQLARQLMIHFAGTVELWVHHELDGEGFAAEAVFGTALLLLGSTIPEVRSQILRWLKAAKRRLQPHLATSRAADEKNKERPLSLLADGTR